MTIENKSIVLISGEPEGTDQFSEILKSVPGVKLEERNETLSGINGAAQEMAVKHDLIIFRTQSKAEDDIAAVEDIRKSERSGAPLIALSDAATTLADIRRLTQAGVDEVLPDTITAAELQELIQTWTKRAQPETVSHSGGKAGKIIAVAQSRGGIGSTTLAVNLADQLANMKSGRGKKEMNSVALVDLDLQFGSVASFLDVDHSPALFQLAMEGIEPDATFLAQSMSTTKSGLSVLASPEGFAPLEALRNSQIKTLIEVLKSEYDYVVVDLPRALVEWISPVLEMTDRMLMITDSSVPGIQQTRRLIDFYTESNIGLNVEVVINHEKKPMMQGRHHKEAAKVLDRKFRYWLPEDAKAAGESVDRGAPLSQTAKRSPLTKSIKCIARDLASELHAAANETQVTK